MKPFDVVRLILAIPLLLTASLAVLPAPVDAQNSPILGLQLTPPNVGVSFSGDLGSPMTIQYATNLSGPWLNLWTMPAQSTNGSVSFVEEAVSGQRYYRLKASPNASSGFQIAN